MFFLMLLAVRGRLRFYDDVLLRTVALEWSFRARRVPSSEWR